VFAHDAERLARFLREAKTLASLNHPNVAAIYGLEDRMARVMLLPWVNVTLNVTLQASVPLVNQERMRRGKRALAAINWGQPDGLGPRGSARRLPLCT
jgi:hypothetical protein